jgi:hypothetical protein
MSIAQVRQYLAESDAKLVSYNDNELLFRRQLVRNWPSERDKLIEEALTYLYQYGSAGNTAVSQAVTNPVADRLTYTGTWRVVSNEKTSKDNEAQWPGITGIIQTLRFGFAQTLSWDEARVINDKLMPGNTSEVAGISNTASHVPNDVIMVEWVNLDPAYTRSMVTTLLTSSTVSSPSIRGNTAGYTGSWHIVSATVGESQLEDGSGIIRAVLARPQYTLNAYDTILTNFYTATMQGVVHYLWGVPRGIAQQIITDWKDNGRSASASLDADDNVNLVLREFDPGASPVTIAGDASMVICSSTETTYYYWGTRTPDAAIYDITNSTHYPNAREPGYVYHKSVSFNRADATFDVIIRETLAIARNPYNEKKVRKAILENRTESVKFSQVELPDIETPAPAVGETTVLDIRINPDCTNDSTETVIVSTENIEIVSWTDVDGIQYKGVYQNWYPGTGETVTNMLNDFITQAGFDVDDYQVSSSFQRNTDGTYDGQFSARVAWSILSISPAPTYTGYTYWDPSLSLVSVEHAEADVVIDYYVPEYTRVAVEYYKASQYTEAEVHQQLTGRGSNGQISVVGKYYKLEMVIGRIRPGERKVVEEGIGVTTGHPVAFPASYTPQPPIPE